jgi:SAM-dependent methyltransferase
MGEVDLERLAEAYGHRAHDRFEQRLRAMVESTRPAPGDLVVDVGGGHGAQALALQAGLGVRAVVLDPSLGMVHRATERGVAAAVARGEELPIAPGAASLIYFHLSIHHGDWRRMLDEAWRVARPGGAIWVWTMAAEHFESSFLAHWFPRVAEIDSARFPDPEEIVSHLSLLGGSPRSVRDVVDVERTAGDWLQAVRDGFVSTLHLLGEDEIEDGLARFQAAHPDAEEPISYRLLFTGVWTLRPSVES